MPLFTKNNNQTDVVTVLDADFIPYACHIDDYTILTKNGELVQVIELQGIHEDVHNAQRDIRQLVRQSLLKELKNPQDFAIWIHTKKNLINIDQKTFHDATFVSPFADKMHKYWRDLNNLNRQFESKIYITLVHKGKNIKITNTKTFFSYFRQSELQKDFFNYTDESLDKINKASMNLVNNLAYCSPLRLKIYEKDKVLYSGLLSFFYNLMFSEQQECELPIADLSQSLASKGKLEIKNNSFISSDNQGKKKYGAIFSIKPSNQEIGAIMDSLLDLPLEISTYQIIDFSYKNYVTNFNETSATNLSKSKDSNLLHLFSSKSKNKYFDNIHSQISFILFADTESSLEQEINIFIDKLENLGIIAVREDIATEDCFFANLPANFNFVIRQKPIGFNEVANYTFLDSYIELDFDSNKPKWEQCITILKTKKQSNYFLHFHSEQENDNSNVILSGPKGCGKSTFANFLISESLKTNPFVISISTDDSAALFFDVIGGKFCHIEQWGRAFFNPFWLVSNDNLRVDILNKIENIEFVKNFLINLTEIGTGYVSTPAQKKEINILIDTLISKNAISKDFNLDSFIEYVKNEDTKKGLIIWSSTGKFSGLFSSQTDVFHSAKPDDKIAFNLKEIVKVPAILVPVLKYLMYVIQHKVENCDKTLLKIDEAWSLFDNPLFGSHKLISWIKFLNTKNVATILSVSSDESEIKGHMTSGVLSILNIQVFYKGDTNYSIYKDVFNLSDSELETIKNLPSKRDFIIKNHKGQTISSGFYIQEKNLLGILSNNKIARQAFEYAVSGGRGADFEKWWNIYVSQFKRLLLKGQQ